MNEKLSRLDVPARLALDGEELTARVERLAPAEGVCGTAWPALVLYRANSTGVPTCAMYEPGLGLALQGAKQILLGQQSFLHEPASYMMTAVDVPVSAQVVRASIDEPCLCLTYRLDLQRIRELLPEVQGHRGAAVSAPGLSMSPLDGGLLDPLLRLVRLLDTPHDLAMLGPLIERELLYRLLTGEQGARLAQIATSGSQGHQISRAIEWLRRHYDEPLRIDELAMRVNMSASSLHHHFRAITAMSPLQYQKQLRLQEARRLLLADQCDVATAAHRVGYESPSQFSREYSRHFGVPPLRDVARMRVSDAGTAA
ncbi:AraC family transcriptional regulator [Dyella terrae]|uniref:AraC family transcriptional regulator n=1 Tax=Dyella terrae TaxID=522259 RepID=UPI001EFEF010|nr:AraC family transcriptional regulator [Dyella terrae]ULU23941.1 AraC family transcriptional regulator [Dyella terrae]